MFASDCELDHLKESLLRDMVIIGLHNKKLQECLFNKELYIPMVVTKTLFKETEKTLNNLQDEK